MSQAATLLAGLTENTAVYSSSESHIVIGNDRFITVPESLKRLAVQYDHDVETVTFECPRFWDEHDMLRMIPYINYLLPNGTTGQYKATNISSDNSRMYFDWTISGNVTQYKGKLSFLVCIKKTDENGYETNHWNSELNQECYISEGLECAQSAVTKYPDIITQLLTRMNEVEEIATPEAMQVYTDTWLEENRESIVAEIGSEVRTKADAIICSTQGETISVSDSSDDYLRGLQVFGKSTQDGTPTPDMPVDIVSTENPSVILAGKNLVKPRNGSISGYTATVNKDGSITVTGAAITTSAIYLNIAFPSADDYVSLVEGNKYYLWCESSNGRSVGTKTINRKGDTIWGSTKGWNDGFNTEYAQLVQIYLESSGHEVGDTSLCGTYRIQLEIGDKFTGFEAYKEVQSISLPHTLPGIPVSSGGNYTDTNGQQWICDEIDFERGVYVQRIETVQVNENMVLKIDDVGKDTAQAVISGIYHKGCDSDRAALTLTDPILSNRYTFVQWLDNPWTVDNSISYNTYAEVRVKVPATETPESYKTFVKENDLYVSYVRKDPIETSLTAPEIAAYKALRTNYPNTTVLNDSGATMELKYNADTKIYVDNAIKAAVAEIVASMS